MSPQNNSFGPPEAYGEPPRTGRFWFDLLAAAAAILISVTSLVVAYRGEETQRGLLAANSWPFLQLSKDLSSGEVKLDVENAGVGPAKIYTFEVFHKGKIVVSATDLLKLCCDVSTPGASGVPAFGYGSVYDNVLRPGEHIVALILKTGRSPQTIVDRFATAMSDLTFQACYCSVLQECWISNLQGLRQVATKSCPVAEHQFIWGDRDLSREPAT